MKSPSPFHSYGDYKSAQRARCESVANHHPNHLKQAVPLVPPSSQASVSLPARPTTTNELDRVHSVFMKYVAHVTQLIFPVHRLEAHEENGWFHRRHPSFHRAQKELGGFAGHSRVEAASSPRPSRARQHGKMVESRTRVRRANAFALRRELPQLQELPHTTRVACHVMCPPVPGLLLSFWPSIQLLTAVAHHRPHHVQTHNAFPMRAPSPPPRLFVYALHFTGKDWRKIAEVVQTRYVYAARRIPARCVDVWR